MQRVILESPYAGDVPSNVVYAQKALLHSLAQGEACIASHLLYPQILNDADINERGLGIQAGLAWLEVADSIRFYMDRGFSLGMREAMKCAVRIKERGGRLGIYARWIEGPVDLSVLGEYEKYLDGCSGARRD